MTLTADECSRQWSLINGKIAEISGFVKVLCKKSENLKEMDPIEAARTHHLAAVAMTSLEDRISPFALHQQLPHRFHFVSLVKLQLSLSNSEYDAHPIHTEKERLERCTEKIRKAEKKSENRPFKVDSEAAKRTVAHYTK